MMMMLCRLPFSVSNCHAKCTNDVEFDISDVKKSDHYFLTIAC